MFGMNDSCEVLISPVWQRTPACSEAVQSCWLRGRWLQSRRVASEPLQATSSKRNERVPVWKWEDVSAREPETK